MKRSHFSVEPITPILQQAAGGIAVCNICRQVGISEQTFYRWRKNVRRDATRRGTGAQAAVRGEHEAEAARRRFVARQSYAARLKKF